MRDIPDDHDIAAAERTARLQLAADFSTAAVAVAAFEPTSGGLSNFSWRASTSEQHWFVRLARRARERLGADPDNECSVLRIVAVAGLAPAVVRCDPRARVLVTRWIDAPAVRTDDTPRRTDDNLTGTEDNRIGTDDRYIPELARAVARLHALATPHEMRIVDFQAQARKLESVVHRVDASLHATADIVFDRLRVPPARRALCHNDLSPSNIVVDGTGRPWLVDWEYAGLGDVAFDLASCTSQHRFTAGQCAEFLGHYRTAGGVCEGLRFELACWGFDYVQWLWYAAFLAPGDTPVLETARQRAVDLARSLTERASCLPHCNN